MHLPFEVRRRNINAVIDAQKRVLDRPLFDSQRIENSLPAAPYLTYSRLQQALGGFGVPITAPISDSPQPAPVPASPNKPFLCSLPPSETVLGQSQSQPELSENAEGETAGFSVTKPSGKSACLYLAGRLLESASHQSLVSSQEFLETPTAPPTDTTSVDGCPQSADASAVPRMQTSLYIPHFSADFTVICGYCLHPSAFFLTSHLGSVTPLSREVIQLMDTHRLKELRKEQKIKKVLNLVFKNMVQKFVSEKYPEIVHVTDAIKKDFCRHYFADVSEDTSLFSKPDYRCRKSKRDSRPLNLTYNHKFFTSIKRCPLFMRDLAGILDQLEEGADAIVKGDVRRFLKRLEISLVGIPVERDLIAQVRRFFSKKNNLGYKMGIKIPWTRQQIRDSVDLVRNMTDSHSSAQTGVASPADKRPFIDCFSGQSN